MKDILVKLKMYVKDDDLVICREYKNDSDDYSCLYTDIEKLPLDDIRSFTHYIETERSYVRIISNTEHHANDCFDIDGIHEIAKDGYADAYNLIYDFIGMVIGGERKYTLCVNDIITGLGTDIEE